MALANPNRRLRVPGAMTPQPVFFSVAKSGGSDSLLIRPSQRQNFRDPYLEFEFLIGQSGDLY